MNILIKGMKMPKEPDEMIELVIFGDGKTLKTGESWRSPVGGKCYYGPSEDMNTYSALTVPAHGRLIDADAVFDNLERTGWYDNADRDIAEDLVLDAPTIIPANEEDDDG